MINSGDSSNATEGSIYNWRGLSQQSSVSMSNHE